MNAARHTTPAGEASRPGFGVALFGGLEVTAFMPYFVSLGWLVWTCSRLTI